jgi:hypothetical protein
VGIDNDYTIGDIRSQSIEKLFDIMASCGKPGYYQMAVEELQRRFLQEIASQTRSLTDSSRRVEAIAVSLNQSVTAMDASVQKLAYSSDKMERLTKGIILLTIALLVLTAVQVVMLFRDHKETPAAVHQPSSSQAAPVTPASPKK